MQHPAINGPCTSFFSIIICRILFKQSCEEEGIQLAALNAQVIAYRDKNEDYDWLEISETYSLPDQRSEYNDFVNGLRAKGGGDTPESGLEALQAAFGKTDWGVPQRTLGDIILKKHVLQRMLGDMLLLLHIL